MFTVKFYGYKNAETYDIGDKTPLFNLHQYETSHLGVDGKLESAKVQKAITVISKEIETPLPQSQLQTFFIMLNDKQSDVSSSVALLLLMVLKECGKLLNSEAKIIIEYLPAVHSITQIFIKSCCL
uniref:Uncharacterized protein n=1 Tax=Panagrolaimus sp. ES5 TaxID=591445 RepID=A0AC34F801_9BILA